MHPVLYVLIGLLAGGIITGLMVRGTWLQRYEDLLHEHELCRQNVAFNERALAYLHELETRYSKEKEDFSSNLASLQAEIGNLETLIAELEMEKQSLQNTLSEYQAGQNNGSQAADEGECDPPAVDNLQAIKGIGPVVAKMLNEAGIYTFDQLAENTPENLHTLLGEHIPRRVNEEAILAQARLYAGWRA